MQSASEEQISRIDIMILAIEKKIENTFRKLFFINMHFLSTEMHFNAKIDSRKKCDGDNDRKLKDIKNI